MKNPRAVHEFWPGVGHSTRKVSLETCVASALYILNIYIHMNTGLCAISQDRNIYLHIHIYVYVMKTVRAQTQYAN